MASSNQVTGCERLVYLASPYTHDYEHIVDQRYEDACKTVAKLIGSGEEYVYSPIVNTHHVAKVGNLDPDFSYWQNFDFFMLRLCSKLYVLMLPGWENSDGVLSEIEMASRIGMDIVFLNEQGDPIHV